MTSPERLVFTVYVAGDSISSQAALENLEHICDQYVPDGYTIKVIDIRDPDADLPSDVLAIPTVVRTSPPPERRALGDLTNTELAVRALGIPTIDQPPEHDD